MNKINFINDTNERMKMIIYPLNDVRKEFFSTIMFYVIDLMD